MTRLIQPWSAAIGGLALLAAASLPLSLPVVEAQAAEFEFPVRSIDEVAVGAMPEITDITANSGVLVFTSSVPLACSVVFGETPAFGQVAVDLDMDGGAHSDHHPVLAGLEPDREYFYRVQGTAADGTLYVGEVLTFRTPALAEAAEVNLASLSTGARVAAVSSNYGGAANDQAWGANQALDGDRSTAWSSAGDGDEGFIEIDLGNEADIGEISVWTRSMSNGTAQIFKFTVTTDRGETFGPFSLADARQPYRYAINSTARRLRLDVIESNGGNVGLVEFGAFAR